MLPVAMSLLLILAGTVLTIALARMIRGGAVVTAILLVSYALRVALAVALYVISAWHLPIFSSLQIEDGFWRFARDAQGYHWLGMAVADRLRWGTEMPNLLAFGQPDWFVMLAFLYRAIGAHPLYVPLINAVLCSAILSLVYWHARSLNGERAGAVAVGIVAIWPSLYLWSAQLLKDSLAILLILALLAMLVVMLKGRLGRMATAAWWVTLIPLTYVLTGLRFYLVLFAVAGLCGVLALRLVTSPAGRRLRTAIAGGACAAVLLTCVVIGQGTYAVALLEPAEPRGGHLRKAQHLEARGDVKGAIFEYARAGNLIPPPLPLLVPEELLTPRFPEGTMEALSRLSLAEAKAAALQPSAATSPSTPALSDPIFSPARRTIKQGVQRVMFVLDVREISKMQRGFLENYLGDALPDSSVTGLERVTSVLDILMQLPRATAAALWAPFPSQWFISGRETGAARHLATIEVIMIGVLTPWLLLGIWRGLRSRRAGAWLLIGYSLAAAAGLGSVVANIGILFRLRLQYLVPLIVIAAAYGATNSKLAARLASSLKRRFKPLSTPAAPAPQRIA